MKQARSRCARRSLLVLLPFLLTAAPLLASDWDAFVREAALVTHQHGLTEEIARAELPAEALPAMRRLLADPDFPRRDNVVAFLALRGDEPSVAALSALLARPFAVTSPEEDRALLLAPEALGRLAARGHGSGLEALLRFTDPDLGLWDFSGLEPAVADAASYREDLLAAAAWGLAWIDDPRADDRLELMSARAGGLAPLDPSALLRTIEQAGELRPRLRGTPQPVSPPEFDPPADPGGPETRALDEQSRTHELGWTYANHPAVTNPMNDARLDEVTDTLDLRTGRDDYDGDTACCVTYQRDGGAGVFGSAGDGLDVIDDSSELSSALGDPVSRFKVVRQIRWCGGPTTNTVGCAATPGRGIVVVRLSDLGTESVVWGHEYGHNSGLFHAGDNRRIMFGAAGSSRNGFSQEECDALHSPPTATQVDRTDIGACLDSDSDSVHDLADNCPNDPNTDQTDEDGDGFGAACDCDDSDAGTYPGAIEICKDGIDQDCDGRDRKGGCPKERCTNGVDDDGDGLIDCADPDCARRKQCR